MDFIIFVLVEVGIVVGSAKWLKHIEKREDQEEHRRKMAAMIRKEWKLPVKYVPLRNGRPI